MLNRRAFLAGASSMAIVCAPQRAAAQGMSVTRRSVRSMDANDPDLAALRRAVAAMRALPASDPRNWIRFADIHRNFCPHSNWYFLPWHRAYIASFERIVRQLSEKPDFALPYWDWSSQRQIPAPFAGGDERSNPLVHSRPGLSRSATLPDDMVGPEVIARIMAGPDFEAFGSSRPRGQNSAGSQWLRRPGTRTELEFNPHDGVHTTLGGDMSQPDFASRDPIFFLHHANVDRLWDTWNRRGNENTRERNWLGFQFSRQFFNPDGSPWDVSVDELQSPAALGYRYDGEGLSYLEDAADAYAADPVLVVPESRRVVSAPAEDNLSRHLLAYRQLSDDALARPTRELRRIAFTNGGAVQIAAASNDQPALRDRPLGIAVALGRQLPEVVRTTQLSPSQFATPGLRGGRQCVWAAIRDIEPPADVTTRVRVFVNCGELEPNTPLTHPTYVTSLSFFGGRHAHGGGSPSARGHQHHAMAAPAGPTGTCVHVDLAPTLARMNRAHGLRGDKLVIQLVPVCPNGSADASRVKPRRVEIAIL